MRPHIDRKVQSNVQNKWDDNNQDKNTTYPRRQAGEAQVGGTHADESHHLVEGTEEAHLFGGDFLLVIVQVGAFLLHETSPLQGGSGSLHKQSTPPFAWSGACASTHCCIEGRTRSEERKGADGDREKEREGRELENPPHRD